MSTELATTTTGSELATGAEGSYSLPSVYLLTDKAKGDSLAAAQAAGVKTGNFFLVDSLGARALDPFRIVPTQFKIDLYVELDDDNKIVQAQYEETPGLSEYRQALVLVVEPDESAVTPAVLTTNRALCRLWKTISEAVEKSHAGSPWFSRGPGFALTQATEFPYFRVQASISAKKTQPKTAGGRPYYLGNSAVSPTSTKLIDTLEAFRESPVAGASIAAFKKKVEWLQKLVNGE